jgi:dTDP-4-dehydrorhamnose reductase
VFSLTKQVFAQLLGLTPLENLMRILIAGCNGQLGYELLRLSRRLDIPIAPYDFPDIDITNKASIDRIIEKACPSIIVNAAAYTAVDKAESEREAAFAVNSHGAGLLADACVRLNIPLIHISTDYVFDGSKKGAYLETDLTSPISVYGQSKAGGEAEVRGRLARHLIIRTAWLYSTSGQNFVKTMIRLGKEKDVIKVVADQYGCPTYAADLAEAILSIIKRFEMQPEIAWGTYHYCGAGQTTWHLFAENIIEIARQFKPLKVKEIVPLRTEEYPTAAARPKNSVLNCEAIRTNFGIEQRPWDKSLKAMIRSLYCT